MPARTLHRKAVQALALLAALAAAAAAPAIAATPKTAEPAVENSSLTAPLFYQLLIGELELRQGAPGTAYDVLLDAARKTKDEPLFRRAADIALQARAGDQALAAARAWREALPGSIDAHRYLVQILVALNRPAETAEPLRSLLALTPAAERPALIAVLPRFLARATDTRAAAGVVEEVLAEPMKAESTRVVATVAAGRAWLAAADNARALQLAQRAAAFDPKAEGPALLALEMLPAEPAAEALVGTYLHRPCSQPRRPAARGDRRSGYAARRCRSALAGHRQPRLRSRPRPLARGDADPRDFGGVGVRHRAGEPCPRRDGRRPRPSHQLRAVHARRRDRFGGGGSDGGGRAADGDRGMTARGVLAA